MTDRLGGQESTNVDRAVFASGKQKELLIRAKELSELTWERFASNIGVSSYNVLRATYLNERNTLPVNLLDKLARHFNDVIWRNWIVDFRRAHWGQAKGGSISLKKWHATMRLKPRSYHDTQSRRFLKARSYKYATSYGYEVRSLHELLVAENLIANGVPHKYEPALRCGYHTLFPDFLAQADFGSVLVEVTGFRAPQKWTRLSEKLRLYLSYKAASSIVVVHLEEDREAGLKVARRLGSCVQLISISGMGNLLQSIAGSRNPLRKIRIVSLAEALRSCRRVNGKRYHWYRLLKIVPKDQWVETLVHCGLPEAEVEQTRRIPGCKKRLIEAFRLANKHRFVPREALVEMIAGTYPSAVHGHFGSMSSLARAAEGAFQELGKA